MRRRLARRLLHFAAVGLVGLVLDAGVLLLVAPAAGWYLGRLLSFWASATTTWWLNRSLTFAASRAALPHLLQEYVSYLGLMLGGAAVNYAVYVMVLHWLTDAAAPLLGVALGSLAGLGVNFISAQRLLTRR